MKQPLHFMPSPPDISELHGISHDAQLGPTDAEWQALERAEVAALAAEETPEAKLKRLLKSRKPVSAMTTSEAAIYTREMYGDCL